MKLKITIIGPKVHDVGYRYFLLGIAMSNRIRKFEAHNIKITEGEAVLAFVDGDELAIKAFCTQVETERPARSEVSNVVFDDFQGEVMRIGEYAQFCSTIQLNKAIPVLLEIRDNTKVTPQILEEIKAVRKNTDLIPQIKKNTDSIPQIKENTDSIPQIKENTDSIPHVLDEIKGLKDDIRPGYASNLRQVQADVRAIKERLGMQ
ncbi:MAG: Acylphosphatase [Methanosaeta sp. PtaB.Bin018]|jgi:acylphosphatase|nr:MAG: Acylphosphatase [Methanosaeta sp. PtaB.Bin018]